MRTFIAGIITMLLPPIAGAQPLLSAADIFRQVGPSVARLVLLDEEGAQIGTATAFVVSADGRLATSYHALVDADDGWVAHGARVELPHRGSFDVEGVIAYDGDQDWAILKIPATGLPTLELGDAQQLEKGEPVVAIGYPAGLDARPTMGSFSGWFEEQLLHDASTSSGNSGGPLVDRNGRVVGITRGELRSGTEELALNDLFFAVDVARLAGAGSEPVASLFPLPLVSPESIRSTSDGAGSEVMGGGGVPTGVWVAIGGGAAAVAGVVAASSASDAWTEPTGPSEIVAFGEVIARFKGRAEACSHQTHEFQLSAPTEVDIQSMPVGFVNGYLFAGRCGGQAVFANRGQPGSASCGFGSELTQLGGCAPMRSGSIFSVALDAGVYTIAVHNWNEVSEVYEVLVEKRN